MPPRTKKETEADAPAEQSVKAARHAAPVPSNAEAAAVLHVYESEVDHVEHAEEGVVATTTDGQRYLLHEDGSFTWLQVAPQVEQILGD